MHQCYAGNETLSHLSLCDAEDILSACKVSHQRRKSKNVQYCTDARCCRHLLQVTAHLDDNNILTIDAQDLDSGRHHLWKHGGGSVVADGIHASELNTNGHYVVDYTQGQAMMQPIRA